MTTTASSTHSPVEAANRPASMRADLVTTASSVVPFGIALGMAVTGLGVGSVAGVLGAPTIYGGTAQLSAMTLMAGGASLAAVVAATMLVNARLMLYGAALEPRFRDQPLWFRLIGPHYIIDGTYLAAVARDDLGEPAAFRRYWGRLGTGVLVVWTASVAFGVLLRPVMPVMPHLGLIAVALFLSMLVPRLGDRSSRASAAAAAVTAPLVAQALPSLGLLAGAAAGLIAGTLSRRRSS